MISDLRALSRLLAARDRLELPAGKLGRAAVLLGLYGPSPDYKVLYTVRTSRVEHHKGQISFPGGRCDPCDKGIVDTALRETMEEIGVRSKDITILGLMDDILTSSQFAVTPVLGLIDRHPYDFVLHEAEVETLLLVPLSHLEDPVNCTEASAHGEGALAHSYSFEGHAIWGATALMTDRFLAMLTGLGAGGAPSALAYPSEPAKSALP